MESENKKEEETKQSEEQKVEEKEEETKQSEEQKVEEKEEHKEEHKEEQKEEHKEDEKEEHKDEHKEDEKEEHKEDEKEEHKEEHPKSNLIFTIDEGNTKCVDCDKEFPTNISINNGVVICDECAEKHKSLGHSISYLKTIDDEFDEYLLNFIVLGGNTKFKRFLEEEKVDLSLPLEQKYKTNACVFYRKNLKNKVISEPILEKNFENPNEIIESTEDDYPEFEKYKIKKKIMKDGELNKKEGKKIGKLGGSIMSFGKKMFGGIKSGASFVAKKTQSGASFVAKKTQSGASFVAKKTQSGASFVAKNSAQTVKKGAGLLGKQVGNMVSGLKKMTTKKSANKGKEDDKKEEDKKEGQEEEKSDEQHNENEAQHENEGQAESNENENNQAEQIDKPSEDNNVEKIDQ